MGSSRKATRGLIAQSAIALALMAGPLFAACSPETVELRGPVGTAQFRVEIADTTAERNQGLMFRDKMASSAGMLFVYETPQTVAFWMKNTLIPLDIIFADATGRIRHVHENAVPGDLTPIPGGDDIQFVLEINGGMAKRLGIAKGVDMRHPAISSQKAAWPCE